MSVKGRRRTVGLEAGAPPNAEGRSRVTSARRPTRPARRRAPRTQSLEIGGAGVGAQADPALAFGALITFT